MVARFRLFVTACLLCWPAVCAYGADGEDTHTALVEWLDQVSEDTFPAESNEAVSPDDEEAETQGEMETSEESEEEASEDASEGEAEIMEDGRSPWPNLDVLHGFYAPDPIAFDDGQTPPYCRGCQRLGCGPGGCDSCGGGCISPTWFIQAEAVALVRSSPFARPVIGTQSTVVINNTLVTLRHVDMSTRDLNFKFEPGTRLLIGRYLGTDYLKRVHTLEFSFFGLFNYNSFHAKTGPDVTLTDPTTGAPVIQIGNFRSLFPTTIGGFSGVDNAQEQYYTNLNSYELNWRVRRPLSRDSLLAAADGTWQKRCTPGFTPSFLFGFRYITVNEIYSLATQGARNTFGSNGQFNAFQTATGDYQVRTTNNMFGFQIGGDLVQQYCRFNIGVRGKTALLANWSTQRTAVSTSDPLAGLINVNRDFSDAGQHTAVLTEFGFIGNWHLRSNMNLRAAYDFMWLTGVANAPRQFVANPVTSPSIGSLQHQGVNFFMGPSAGIEVFW